VEPIFEQFVRDLTGGFQVPVWVTMLVSLGLVLVFIALNAMFMIWLERKICGRIQRRMGPMLTGPKAWGRFSMWTGGWLQTPCDSGKLLFKEDIVPAQVDRFGFMLAPVLIFMGALAVYVPLPVSSTSYAQPGPTVVSVADLDIGLLYIVAITTFTVLAILTAGWSSNNKYSLLGGMRAGVQLLSYELPMLFALMGPMVLAGSLSLGDLVQVQQAGLFGVPLLGWFLVPSFLGAVVYLICAVAETNRPPFDMPEAEQELVSGFNIEYTAMRFAMFYLAEFSNTFVVCMIFTAVFLGGWTLPGFTPPSSLNLGFFSLPYFDLLAGMAIFFAKAYAMVLLLMWIRWTFPRLRPDHLMTFGWKFLLPLSFVNLLVCIVLAAIQQIYFGGNPG
jgi:NADH-quinone oxidoreductase subunit H